MKNRNLRLIKKLLILFSFMNISVIFAQLDSIHYFPPLKQSSSNSALQQQEFYFSTPENTPFSILVYRGNNTAPITTITGLANNSSKTYDPGDGDNNITLVSNSNTGVVLSNSGLRFESSGGEKFYVNFRGRSSAQAGSLTCKGQAALGTDFRWGGIPNKATISGRLNSVLGIMATEDNTQVTISGYNPNCEFRLAGDPDGITSDVISITLHAGQSYVLEAIPSESASNDDGWLGATVSSDKPIAISSGGLNFGITSGASRDTGIDQPVPTNLLGKEYVFIRGRGGNESEFPVIVAYQNNTEVYVGGNYFTTINNGEYIEIPGSNYSSSNPGANMFVSTSKEVYAYQCLAGQSATKTVGMNFIAPLNCLLPSSLDEIPKINEIAGAFSGESAITIIASTSTPDANISLTDGSGTVSLPVASPVSGTSDWKTFYVTNLTGEVEVNSTGPIAVGTFMRYGSHAGLAGYFSGFDTAPVVDVTIGGAGCFPNATIAESTGTFDAYQWYHDGVAIPGANSNTIIPTTIGDYYVDVTKGTCTYSSNTISLFFCVDEVFVEIVDAVDPIIEGDSEIFSIQVTNLGIHTITNLTIATNISSTFEVIGVSHTAGSWTAPNWVVGSLTSGETQTLTLSTNSIVGIEGGTFTSTVFNTQDQIDANLVLDKLSEDTRVYDGEIGIEHTGVFTDDGDGIAETGEEITFAYTLYNNGEIPLSNISISDPFFGGVISGTYTGDTNNNGILEVSETWVLVLQYPITNSDLIQGETHTAATVTGVQSNGFNQVDDSDDPNDFTNVDDNGDGEPDDDTIVPLSRSVSIDFDGVDDHVQVNSLGSSSDGFTYMAWVKLDPNTAGLNVIMGESNHFLYVNPDKTITSVISTNNGSISATTSEAIPTNTWVHLTSVYDQNHLKVFINGEAAGSVETIGSSLLSSTSDFIIGKSPIANSDFIKADIQEVRVYAKPLSDTQIKEQVYQAIYLNGGKVYGAITNTEIDGLSPDDLKLYLKLTSAANGTTNDTSQHSNNGFLFNMTTVQETTAPIPYIAENSGEWTDLSTWKYGDVWDITNLPHKDWAIVSLTNYATVSTVASHSHLGLLLDAGTSLVVKSDQMIQNSLYLKLDGKIDLQGESQLLQEENSVLDVSSAGYIERDQQGHTNIYYYNYWCSPVGSINTHTNNKSYSIAEVLHDGTNPSNILDINFTDGYDGAPSSPITLSNYWLFAFRDQTSAYQNWEHLGSTGILEVGEGYTQKGSGSSANNQNYTFVGKPNNGTITHSINSSNIYLIGNPYPSALDANLFIQDNLETLDTSGNVITPGAITGALYFWEHWGGESHTLDQYQGGYSTYNLTGATIAISPPNVSGIGNGTILPKRYIPVGQGFFVQGDSDGGFIEFSNTQRAFQRESDGESVFKSLTTENVENENDNISRMYFKFKTPEGAERQLLLGVKPGLEDGINYGYDAPIFQWNFTDCAFDILGVPMVIQGIGQIDSNQMLPLKIKVGATGEMVFSAEDLSGLPSNLQVFFYDSQTNTYNLLDQNSIAILTLPAGTYEHRFYLVFQENSTLDIPSIEVEVNSLTTFYNSKINSLVFQNMTLFSIEDIKVYNTIGQQIWQDQKSYYSDYRIELPFTANEGYYFVKFTLDKTHKITKKIKIH
ncbi:LamG-like jellyroll fold domain-containing protein [Kordia sp.]|uniref:LamG-like jellyroll fold domain-containing protein n=1 Tax=Kordia sp. TaxID=1965332 RepID=UPI0025C73349|nr:LamG-like jellyroll fold domain-containing protein [Kordia sp.]MCH2194303.1 hypothetical protein [Kordia sp.]